MDDPSAIYAAIHDKEKELKALRENGDIRQSMGVMNELLSGVRKLYRLLVVNFPSFARERKDIIGQLWKTCFYKQIEDFRKAIKNAKVKHDSLLRGPSPAALQDVRRHLSSLSHEFLLFLSDCIRYFQKLMGELESKVSKSDNNDAELFEFITGNVYRCLLYLGDLSRYKELYAEKDSKDFVESVRFYERAALIMPASGNAHNQLAMLATYNEAESTALYHYCRSVMAKAPFSGGFENLSSLFEKNVQTTERLSQELKQAPPELQARKNNDVFRFKSFLSSFVRVHGLFFAWSVRMHLEFIKKLDSSTSQASDTTTLLSKLNTAMARNVLHNTNSSNNDIDLERFHDLTQSLLEDFDMLVVSGNRLSDLYLLRLMTVCIFSVHFAELPSEDLLNDSASFSSFLQQSSASFSSQQQQQETEVDIGDVKPTRSLIQSLALSLVFGLVNRACLKIINHVEGANASSKRALVDKMMPMLTIFSIWLGQHPQYLLASEEVEAPAEDLALPSVIQDSMSLDASLSGSIWKRKYCVHLEQGRNESRVRSSLRTALSLLHEHFSDEPMFHRGTGNKANTKGAGNANDFPLLREFAEMRGYLPLQESLEKRFTGFHPLKKTMSWLPEQTARKERQTLITSFIVDHIFEAGSNAMDRREAADVNVGGGRMRQLFQVESGRKIERDRSDRVQPRNAASVAPANNITYAATKNAIENAQLKAATAKKGAYAVAVMGTAANTKEKDKEKEKDHPEKKRAKGDNGKIRGPPALDPTISMPLPIEMVVNDDDVEEKVAMPGIFAAVKQDMKAGQQTPTPAAEPFSFFAFDAGNKIDGLWSYSLEEDDAADMSFDHLNQSIAEATADQQQQQQAHTQFLSANTSMNQFHGNNGLFTSHANNESRLNEIAHNGNDDEDFEDEVVFRPVFPRAGASIEQTSSPFLLSRHATPLIQKSTPEPDMFGAIGTTPSAATDIGGLTSFGSGANNASSNNIWSKFGVGLGMSASNLEVAPPLQATTTMSSTWNDTIFNTGAPLSGLSAGFPGSNQLSSSLPLSSWDEPLPSISALPKANAAPRGPPGLIPAAAAGPPPGLKSAVAAAAPPAPPGLGNSDRKVSRGEAFLSSLGNSQSNNWTT